MKLEIQSIADKGNYQKERLILHATADTDLGDYVIFQTGFSEESVTTNIRHTFWPPYKAVQAGDLMILYTKSGRTNTSAMKSGSNAHFFYWGLNSPIWDASDYAPVLLHSPEWEGKDPAKL